ncbi:sigma-70 family RNA polymerase sigma factor [Achromobacter xylosoxidans]|jgi:RNA polymerase sigma factor (sigma-70 family)|uniref:Sigma-70 family RNA polymerase sigma factor n=1 Tax=Alcaligenes xylosoxydans xylosoxydans TaxID=85698 RepID=A0A0D6ICD0_ALCXX|nr:MULTISPECIES: sigma-70 family RNA polymerase sigma factor [Achromobacter]AHC48991.1 RNA polymerase sigma-70 factor, ECF subfamily [Achromobacter xylosoxidans NBRC 15126 = ATCC 27061]EFV84190.1 sigma-70 region 2 [Achromobacter xylosoxidans C54]KWU16327.1 RNA polymerase subunit sigma [Achromobacter xylosoxidans]MCH4574268.1 sigma-70 family RNA polymerase sigma factor [Achromobacter xylosoxidans]MCZ8402732.1 sigma-70 family RNA polymerase sigma factor [Achromobacter xylosoxidans]
MSDLVPAPTLEALYCDHHSWLVGMLRRKLGNGDSAADLAQDTFLRVLANRNVDAILRPREYLATIARGLVTDAYRRQAIERAYLETLAARPEPVAISPETRAILLETVLAIDRMLDQLGPRTREIFLLAQFEELTYAQVGSRLGVSVTTVKKHMVRALTQCLLLAAD